MNQSISGVRVGGLFSGFGGLEMGVQAVLGGRVVWHSEIEPGPCRVLAHHWPNIPNLGDITAVDWPSVDPVDVICGGSPCQDVSAAGRRAGMRPGTRSGLWESMREGIAQLRPGLVVWENVRGVTSAEAHSDMEPCAGCVGGGDDGPVLRALGRVLGDLASLGYDAQWHGLRAADVGAPHGRFRVFVVAADTRRSDGERRTGAISRSASPRDQADLPGSQGRERARRRDLPGRRATADTAGNSGWFSNGDPETPSDTDGDGLSQFRREQPSERDSDRRSGSDIVWGAYEPAIRRWERVLGRVAPAPTELGAKDNQRLSPAFVEWLMGLAAGHVTDSAIGLTRNEQLKALGNGVVPQQAAAAIRVCLDRAALERAA